MAENGKSIFDNKAQEGFFMALAAAIAEIDHSPPETPSSAWLLQTLNEVLDQHQLLPKEPGIRDEMLTLFIYLQLLVKLEGYPFARAMADGRITQEMIDELLRQVDG